MDPDTGAHSLLFQVNGIAHPPVPLLPNAYAVLCGQIDYPEIADGVLPRHRFMSAYEQRAEAPDRKYQFLLFAAEPYETIAFKVQSRDVETSEDKLWTRWDHDAKRFFMQFHFKVSPPPSLPPPQTRRPLPHPVADACAQVDRPTLGMSAGNAYSAPLANPLNPFAAR